MDLKSVYKFTRLVNSVLLGMVTSLMLFFYLFKATILVYFSIPTILVYLIGYFIISRYNLWFYVNVVYIWIPIYMSVTTICLGYRYGFHLYSLSLIPIIHITKYISYKIQQRKVNTAFFSTLILACYLGSTVYVSYNGAIYEGSDTSAAIFWVMNSAFVFWFLIYYTKILIKTTISSEEKLKEMSYTDKLTKLYNRHYMMEKLETSFQNKTQSTISMIDIDDFKKINDVYGHNAGDYVLQKLSQVMKDTCSDSIISRWGGEEFLILLDGKNSPADMMEQLRSTVEGTVFEFEQKVINVSVTIGLSDRGENKSIDQWIQNADKKLYLGKKQGKNVVIG